MRALDHREPGILGVVLDDDALYAELICDGIHTTPEAVRLWLRSKGLERAMLGNGRAWPRPACQTAGTSWVTSM